jgi:transaldolase/glucose-6-phosphate isomerase
MTTPAQSNPTHADLGSAAPRIGSRLLALYKLGQSVWLDYIRRDIIDNGELARLVREDGLCGVTSNPSIFEKAISESAIYAELIGRFESHRTENGDKLDSAEIYENIAILDIQDAADILRPVYDRSNRRDGYVSIEVSPFDAFDTASTLVEARRLWREVGRENVMIKVPGTPEGLPAITELIGDGINVNVTLLFAQDVYKRVAEAFLAGVELFASKDGDLSKIGSVASFFVSRIDTNVDKQLDDKIKVTANANDQSRLKSLKGKVAIANAKLAYELYRQIFSGARWEALRARGARTQRLLWASTSSKNAAYRDVMYVEQLIGPDTVDTIPPGTMDAFRDHGVAQLTLEKDVEAARQTMAALELAGISMKSVTDQLLAEGVKLFSESFEKLLKAIGTGRDAIVPPQYGRQTENLPAELEGAVMSARDNWTMSGKARHLWTRDASLWTGTDEGQWLGWLDIVESELAESDSHEQIAQRIRADNFSHAVLLGMGGSSLCVEVMKLTFGKFDGFPEILVLDSTDPAQVRTIERQIDIKRTLFIVSSKSGTTLEPNIFLQYFYGQLTQAIGGENADREAAKHFVAITDPGSSLEKLAAEKQFCAIIAGVPSIGGRYSVLSNFGILPATVQGVNVKHLLARSLEMVNACGAPIPADHNPGVQLGAVLGMLGVHGHDKVTLITSPGIADLGAWLEQLLAESTGKDGKGLIPVDRETLGEPRVYGNDRLFVYARHSAAPSATQDAAVEKLEQAGQPVVRISIADIYDLGQEFFRWEFATAVAGAILGINAFNQPDVEASKLETRKLTSQYEANGALPEEKPFLQAGGVSFFADPVNAGVIQRAAGANPSLASVLHAHLCRISTGDYFALLAYVERNDTHEAALQKIRLAVRDNKRVATCLGFGPRFLHSTGQAYKGGPNTGVFLQITCDDAEDIAIPGQKFTFGIVKAAQARGDFEVLAQRKRRALRIHIGKDVAAGLDTLIAAASEALK